MKINIICKDIYGCLEISGTTCLSGFRIHHISIYIWQIGYCTGHRDMVNRLRHGIIQLTVHYDYISNSLLSLPFSATTVPSSENT